MSAITDARTTLSEAAHVARGAGGTTTDKPFFELKDIRLRGLQYLLRDDYRPHAFVGRELVPLAHHDLAHGTDLMGTLSTSLTSGGNKTVAAHMANIRRPPPTGNWIGSRVS